MNQLKAYKCQSWHPQCSPLNCLHVRQHKPCLFQWKTTCVRVMLEFIIEIKALGRIDIRPGTYCSLSYLSRRYMRKGEDHFLHLFQSSGLGIRIYLQANSRTVHFPNPPFVVWTAHSAANMTGISDNRNQPENAWSKRSKWKQCIQAFARVFERERERSHSRKSIRSYMKGNIVTS